MPEHDQSDDELLGDRAIQDDATPSTPEVVDEDDIFDDDRPLPMAVLTERKNARVLLDFFLSADIPDNGLNKSEISEQTGVSTNGIRRTIGVLIDFNVVKLTTSPDAHFTRYATNEGSDAVRELRRVNNVLHEAYDPDRPR